MLYRLLQNSEACSDGSKGKEKAGTLGPPNHHASGPGNCEHSQAAGRHPPQENPCHLGISPGRRTETQVDSPWTYILALGVHAKVIPVEL